MACLSFAINLRKTVKVSSSKCLMFIEISLKSPLISLERMDPYRLMYLSRIKNLHLVNSLGSFTYSGFFLVY